MPVAVFILALFSVLFSSVQDIREHFERNESRERDDFYSYYDNDSNSRNEDELIDYIESIMQSDNVPGLSVAVVKNNVIAWRKSFGLANIEDNTPVSVNTMFMLASVSKTVTATALMQLWEMGLIDLEENVNNYLPFYITHPDYPNSPITAKMLLTHTSGIKDNWNVMDYYDGDSEIELGDYLEAYLTPEGDLYNSNANFTNHAPGTNYRYSNIGAAVIGYLVEVISGQAFNEYCNENIFSPLAMESRWFLSELDIDNIAIPYNLDGSGDSCYEIGCGVFNQNNPCQCDEECIDYGDCCDDYEEVCGEDGSGSGDGNYNPINHYGYADYPSGQLRSSASDLAKFMATYINGGVYEGVRILNEDTIEFIKSIPYPNIDSQQGLIWYYKSSDNRTLFGHNGGDLGVSTEMFISLSDDIGVIVLANSAVYSSIINIENAIFDYAEDNDFQLLGDLNDDMAIDVLDVIVLLNMILDGEYIDIGDVNFDGTNNVQDIVIIVNLILGT